MKQVPLPFPSQLLQKPEAPPGLAGFLKSVVQFRKFGAKTLAFWTNDQDNRQVLTLVNEFWTAKQRKSHSLHEISYRACFKAQLPAFFIQRLTKAGDRVYDPFMGRGTTLLEAGLMGRNLVGCDINPVSQALLEPRLQPPTSRQIERRLRKIPWNTGKAEPQELLVFYHPETLKELDALKAYLGKREIQGNLDGIDRWIRMVALNRLTGHSGGFFSVYTLPPNQAVSLESQKKINERRKQKPLRRDVPQLILKKSQSLLRELKAREKTKLRKAARQSQLLLGDAARTPSLESNSVQMVITSPPFLDVVDYATDNWLRCWFLGQDSGDVAITQLRKLKDWQEKMTTVFQELHRVLCPGGYVAFEVGEVRGGQIKLEEAVLPCMRAANIEPLLVLINAQDFTKTANCWGIDNNKKGTNTNRIVLGWKRLPSEKSEELPDLAAVPNASRFAQTGQDARIENEKEART